MDILDRALQASDMQKMKALVEHAYNLASGLDPYLDVISTPPSKVGWTSGWRILSARLYQCKSALYMYCAGSRQAQETTECFYYTHICQHAPSGDSAILLCACRYARS